MAMSFNIQSQEDVKDEQARLYLPVYILQNFRTKSASCIEMIEHYVI